jgi:hypothetical protein
VEQKENLCRTLDVVEAKPRKRQGKKEKKRRIIEGVSRLTLPTSTKLNPADTQTESDPGVYFYFQKKKKRVE